MKYIMPVICICFLTHAKCQNTKLKLEGYAAPGLFFEHFNNDSLIPPQKRNGTRLGDVTSYAVQAALPLKNEHWVLKAGIGFSQRHYSLNKYSLNDFFTAIFLFDSPPRRDSFNLSYIRFTNNYFQLPFSAAYVLNPANHRFQTEAGLNIRTDFLLKSNAALRFDSSYKIPLQSDLINVQHLYTANASKLIITLEPYIQTSFAIYKNLGIYMQFKPFSFYSYKLDKQFTASTNELLNFTFGISYSFNK